jgi:hypothetical protein
MFPSGVKVPLGMANAILWEKLCPRIPVSLYGVNSVRGKLHILCWAVQEVPATRMAGKLRR